MNKKIPIMLLAAIILILPLASATHSTSTVLHGQVLDISGVPEEDADLRVTISTANSCDTSLVYNTTFANATNGDGVYNLDISADLDFNQLYYTCVFVNTEQMGNPQPARIGQGEIDENDVDFYDLDIGNDLDVTGDVTATSFIGDGSALTGIDAGQWNRTGTTLITKVAGDDVEINGNLEIDTGSNDGSFLMNVTGEGWWTHIVNAEEPYLDFSQEFFAFKSGVMTFLELDAANSKINFGQDLDMGNNDIYMGDDQHLYLDDAETVSLSYNSTSTYTEHSNDLKNDGDLLMTNNQELQGEDTSGNARHLARVSNGNYAYFGNVYMGTIIDVNGGNHIQLRGNTLIIDGRTLGFNTASTRTLWWDPVDLRFEFNNNLYANGDLNITGNGYVNSTEQICTAENGLCGSGGTSYWNRTGTTLETATADDDVNITGDLFSSTAQIGDGTNYVDINGTGYLTLHGDARVTNFKEYYAYNMGGIAGTYNGVTNAAAGLAGTNGLYFKSFDDGAGAATAEATNFQFVLPEDYEAGTDFSVTFAWTVATTATTNVRWQVGYADISNADVYNTATYTWATPANYAGTGTAWERQDISETFSGTGLAPRDIINIVIFRDADNAGDTYTGDAYISTGGIEYQINKLGAAI